MALSNPESPDWFEAFTFLMSKPETADVMMETFSETLAQMGVEPSGKDPVTGEPKYGLKDIAQVMGIPETDLDLAIEEAEKQGKPL